MTFLLVLPLAATLNVIPPAAVDWDVRMPPAMHAASGQPGPSMREAADAFAQAFAKTAAQAARPQRTGSWAARHPVLLGTLVGLVGGFLIGYASGTDGILDDYSAEGNGIILGGIGAAAGAIVGWTAYR